MRRIAALVVIGMGALTAAAGLGIADELSPLGSTLSAPQSAARTIATPTANSPTSAKSAPTTGQYRPLTLWSKITLSSSYFTNPQRAQAIDVAYSYEGPEFDGVKLEALWNLARENKISFGIEDKKSKSISVIPLSTLQRFFTVKQSADLGKVLERDDVKVIAAEKALLGVEAQATAVVKTTSEKQSVDTMAPPGSR